MAVSEPRRSFPDNVPTLGLLSFTCQRIKKRAEGPLLLSASKGRTGQGADWPEGRTGNGDGPAY